MILMLAPPAFADEPVELTFIANEGVIIRHGDRAIAIDTPASNSYDGTFALPSAEILEAMTTGGDPVGELDWILFTHIHGDHFDAASTVAITEGYRQYPIIWGGDQVIDAFVEAGGDEQRAWRPILDEGSCGFDGAASCRSLHGLHWQRGDDPTEDGL